MGLFKKNPNEINYQGGKKHFIDVIEYNGPTGALIWKQPEEDFNTKSVLIVNPGEEAIFVNNGKIEQVFESGRYQLTTQNYPFISRLATMFSGGISTFHSVIYFVNKTITTEMNWGTVTPIQIRDKIYNIRVDVRARGSYKIKIDNPSIFFEKIFGNDKIVMINENLDEYFVNEFQSKIKTEISKFLDNLNRELIGIDQYLEDISNNITPSINSIFELYGIKCVNFNISGLDVDSSKYDLIDNSQIESISKIRLGQADIQVAKNEFDVLGKDWARKNAANILNNLANNPGAGGPAAMGAGMGMGMAAGSVFNGLAQQIFEPMSQNVPKSPQMESRFDSSPFEINNANEQNKNNDEPLKKLTELKQLLDAGFITQDEFNAKRKEILSRM